MEDWIKSKCDCFLSVSNNTYVVVLCGSCLSVTDNAYVVLFIDEVEKIQLHF